MRAGFARVCITPPVGTTMMGFGGRDMDHGCEGTHDDIYVRALALEHGGAEALLMTYDLCFLGREDANRFKGAIGRVADLLPSQILMNTSHNHVGPSVGTWYSAGYECPDRLYLNDLEQATVQAALEARAALRPVTLSCGVTRSSVPVNRRRKMPDGSTQNRPNPGGYVYDKLPVCQFTDAQGKPVCLLFSISTHPSMMGGHLISAEYPGAATDEMDRRVGAPVSMFFQGVGGDSKPSVIAKNNADAWQRGTWELMDEAGRIIADEVSALLDSGLDAVGPALKTASTEMEWALEPTPPRSFFEEAAASVKLEDRAKSVYYMWAMKQLECLNRGDTLPTSVTLTAHGVMLGKGLRMVGIEGEATAPWGKFIEESYGDGTTIPLGYTDGQGLYLPNSAMLPEGGYEVVSSWEYGLPAGLAPGMEEQVRKALAELRDQGIA